MFPVRVTRRRPGTIITIWRCVACDRHWTNEPPAAALKISCYQMDASKTADLSAVTKRQSRFDPPDRFFCLL